MGKIGASKQLLLSSLYSSLPPAPILIRQVGWPYPEAVAVTGTTPSPMGLVKVLITLTTKGAKQVAAGCIPMRAVTTSPPAPTLKRGTV